MAKPLNVLVLFSDEHRRDAMGCAGHPLVNTPHLDELAAKGVQFTNAYTPSPICVPARAALATGQYVHETRCWSNAQAWRGEPQSWGHRLQAAGRRVDSIGKLHYRGSEDDNGFDHEHLPLYIKDGIGWIKGLLRNHEAVLDCRSYAEEIGSGESSYTDYDLAVTERACQWLEGAGNETAVDQPWTLFVSWLRPHYPLVCPPAYYSMYPFEQMDEARFTGDNASTFHPVLKAVRDNFNYDDFFDEETRQIARAGYYGLCSFLDAQVGRVLSSLEASGQLDNTLIIYTSDHGDHNGDRGLWTKMTLYEESAGIPLIVAGPDIPRGVTSNSVASLVDLYPTVLSAAGVPDDDTVRPGIDLRDLASGDYSNRPVISEYHDGGSPTGMFMLRCGRWKYNVYPGYEPELFDLSVDPGELHNLAGSTEHLGALEDCARAMSQLVDPIAANDLAFADQQSLINQLGGAEAILNSDEYDFTPIPSA